MALPVRQVVLITGITGQDGSYLAEFLLAKGYEVHGLVRRHADPGRSSMANLQNIIEKIHLHYGDITDAQSVWHAVHHIMPTEIYNLAGQSHVTYSFEVPSYTMEVNVMGLLNILNAIVQCKLKDHVRLYQASSSEMFCSNSEAAFNEDSTFNPQSPYGVSKLSSHFLIRSYRVSHGIFAASGISFNHESPRRGVRFVSMRIARAAARHCLGLDNSEPLTLAGVDTSRDWGHAKDYVECMWLILQHKLPSDFIIASGMARTVKEFATAAYACIGIELPRWQGSGQDLVAKAKESSQVLIQLDAKLQRPAEIMRLCGDSSRARQDLGWIPQIDFQSMVHEMVNTELERLSHKNS